jgi:hypothetical protein
MGQPQATPWGGDVKDRSNAEFVSANEELTINCNLSLTAVKLFESSGHHLSYAQGSTSANARLMRILESWFHSGRRWQITAEVGVGQLSNFRGWIGLCLSHLQQNHVERVYLNPTSGQGRRQIHLIPLSFLYFSRILCRLSPLSTGPN